MRRGEGLEGWCDPLPQAAQLPHVPDPRGEAGRSRWPELPQVADLQTRLHLVQLAVADNIQIKACDIEFKLPKPSYTIDTLTYLQERYPNYEFVVIMSEDNLEHFAKWKNYEQILK